MKPCGVALRVYNNAYLVLSADRVFKYRILPKRHANKQIVTEYVCFMHRAVYTNRQKREIITYNNIIIKIHGKSRETIDYFKQNLEYLLLLFHKGDEDSFLPDLHSLLHACEPERAPCRHCRHPSALRCRNPYTAGARTRFRFRALFAVCLKNEKSSNRFTCLDLLHIV